MRKTQILKIQKNQYQKEKLFSCTQCTSKFANPNYLKIHKNQHPNEKLVCGRVPEGAVYESNIAIE